MLGTSDAWSLVHLYKRTSVQIDRFQNLGKAQVIGALQAVAALMSVLKNIRYLQLSLFVYFWNMTGRFEFELKLVLTTLCLVARLGKVCQ